MKRGRKAEDPATVLQRLIVVCADGAAGYDLAATLLAGPERLHRVLAENAAHREEMARALMDALSGLGRTPEHHGSVRGAVHRGWALALAAFAGGNAPAARAILRECERGEEASLEAFARALGRSLPAEIHALVQSQLGRLLEANAALRREIAALEEVGFSATG